MATASSDHFSYQSSARLAPHANAPGARGDRLPRSLKATEHLYSQAQHPKLKYLFDDRIFRERARRLADIRRGDDDGDSVKLPTGFPDRIHGPRVWSGNDFRDKASYSVTLDAVEIAEIEDALSIFHDLTNNGSPGQVSPDNFPLPTLGPKLRSMAITVFSGRGFVLLRGLNPAKYSSLDNIVIANGISGYIAKLRGAQDDFGNMVVHMSDMESSIGVPLHPTYTQNALPFHNDAAEIIAMYGMQSAPSGGDTTFASAAKIYNHLAATRPDVLRTMAEPNWKYPENHEPLGYTSRPLLFPSPSCSSSSSTSQLHDHLQPFWFFSRRRLTGLPSRPVPSHVPSMSEKQAEALDLFELSAQQNSFAVKLLPGDVFIFHNLALVHGRTAFRDDAEPGEEKKEEEEGAAGKRAGGGGGGGTGRHIMRTYLSNRELSWRPPALTEMWFRIYGDREKLGRAIWKTKENVEVKHVTTDSDTSV